MAKKIFGRLKGLNVLVLGAGEMASLTATHLRAHEVGRLTIASRTLASAESLARELTGQAVQQSEFADMKLIAHACLPSARMQISNCSAFVSRRRLRAARSCS